MHTQTCFSIARLNIYGPWQLPSACCVFQVGCWALYVVVRSASQEGTCRWRNAPGTRTNNNYTVEAFQMLLEVSWPSALIGQLKKWECKEKRSIKGRLGNQRQLDASILMDNRGCCPFQSLQWPQSHFPWKPMKKLLGVL